MDRMGCLGGRGGCGLLADLRMKLSLQSIFLGAALRFLVFFVLVFDCAAADVVKDD
jgi:hypothetical protein